MMNMGPEENDKMCHALYNCNQEDLKHVEHDETYQALNEIVKFDRRKRRSINLRKGTLFGRPVRKPANSLYRAECRKCEEKRSSCTTVSDL